MVAKTACRLAIASMAILGSVFGTAHQTCMLQKKFVTAKVSITTADMLIPGYLQQRATKPGGGIIKATRCFLDPKLPCYQLVYGFLFPRALLVYLCEALAFTFGMWRWWKCCTRKPAIDADKSPEGVARVPPSNPSRSIKFDIDETYNQKTDICLMSLERKFVTEEKSGESWLVFREGNALLCVIAGVLGYCREQPTMLNRSMLYIMWVSLSLASSRLLDCTENGLEFQNKFFNVSAPVAKYMFLLFFFMPLYNLCRWLYLKDCPNLPRWCRQAPAHIMVLLVAYICAMFAGGLSVALALSHSNEDQSISEVWTVWWQAHVKWHLYDNLFQVLHVFQAFVMAWLVGHYVIDKCFGFKWFAGWWTWYFSP
jgi:hypothetical protein